jgi:hypothetical protein
VPRHRPSRSDHDMLTEHNLRLREAVEQTVVDHRLGTCRAGRPRALFVQMLLVYLRLPSVIRYSRGTAMPSSVR